MSSYETVALQAVEEAGERVRLAARRAKRIEYKSAVDLVTETDREVEALVVSRLRAAFPDHLIVAEEAAASGDLPRPGPDQYAWYLDPLDGTTNFAHAVPHFAVSLALAQGPELLFAIVQDPLREETFVAWRGGGATLNGEPIHVSTTANLGQALLGTGFPYDRRERSEFYLRFFTTFLRQARDVRRIGAAALDLCYVACGRFDAFWEFRLNPWDVAAGTLIVREAGGIVSDFHGAPIDLFGTQTLASNGHLQATLLDAFRTLLTSES